jgi:hypothetical protein
MSTSNHSRFYEVEDNASAQIDYVSDNDDTSSSCNSSVCSDVFYGNFSEDSEDLYFDFSGDRVPLNLDTKICVCGVDICNVHPSNRSSGLYDPMDYIDGEYLPNFDYEEITIEQLNQRVDSLPSELIINIMSFLRPNFVPQLEVQKLVPTFKSDLNFLYNQVNDIRRVFIDEFDIDCIEKAVRHFMRVISSIPFEKPFFCSSDPFEDFIHIGQSIEKMIVHQVLLCEIRGFMFEHHSVLNVQSGLEIIESEPVLQVQAGMDYNYLRDLFFYKINCFDEKYTAKLIDDIVMFVTLSVEKVENLNRLDTVLRAVNIFLKCRYNESTFHIYKDRIFPYIRKIFSGMFVQSDYIDEARCLLNSYKNIANSEIAIKLYKCAMYILSFSLFEKVGLTMDNLGYSRLEQAALKKKFFKKSDFAYAMADTLLFILERGYQVYITGDLETIFHSGGTYKNLYDTCRDLQRKSHLLNNPEEHGFTESAFRADLDNVVEKLTNIKKHSFRLTSTDRNIISMTLNDMLMLRDDINTRSAARRHRKAPFALLINGDSGIGKTTITHIIYTYFAKLKKLPLGTEHIFTRNPAAKFWDGYTSSCHTIVLDDVANEAPELGDPKSLNEIIQIINNAAFCPDQASLEDKGKTPMRASLVIGTTNIKNLNAYHYFACPSAVQRRFPYIITPSVKSEYKDERGMLNSSKVNIDEPYPDLWNFKIERVCPVPIDQGRRYAKLELVHDHLNLREFLIWMQDAVISFDRDQKRVANCVESMKNVDLCMCCDLPDTLCKANVQSKVIAASSILITIFLLFINSYQYQMLVLCIKYVLCYQRNMQRFRIARDDIYRKCFTSTHWEIMGQRMSNKMKHPVFFFAIATTVPAIYAIYKNLRRLAPQGGVSEDVGKKPVAELNGRENVWYNNTMDLSPANFTRESSSSKNMEFTQFCSKINQNLILTKVHITEKNCKVTGRMLCLGGHIYLTNNHNVPPLKDSTYMDILCDSKSGLSQNMRVVISEADLHRIPEKDLAFVTLRELPPRKKIIQFFQLGESNGIFNGAYVAMKDDGQNDFNAVKNIKLCPERRFLFKEHNIDARNSVWRGFANVETRFGECGSPLVIQSSYGYSIVGLHYLSSEANGKEVYANNVDGEFVREIYESLNPYNVESGVFDLVSAPSSERVVTDLHKKSVFRYIDQGNIQIYGSFTGFRGKGGSSVTNTPMSYILSQEGYKIKFCKPEMKSWVPWHIAAKGLLEPVHEFDTGILNLCSESYIANVMSKIDIESLKEQLIVLDNFTAINGAPVAYIDKINRNTSAGNPWKKSKKYFLTNIAPLHGMNDPVAVDDEIMDRVDQIIETYLQNKRCHPNFCAHLKDEPVKFKKAQIGKTRVFTGAPFDWCIVVRKYLLSFTRFLQNNRMAFEAAVGTIAQSLEWQELYDYIVIHGENRIVAGDYAAFDKKMSPKETLLVFDVIIYFCKISGNYTDDDIRVIRGIAEDTAFALVDFNGDLVALFGSNPSGNPLTVIINSIVNSLRMRYTYYLLNPQHEVMSFNHNVSLMTYGDDNIMSVNNSCEWFNHTAIAQSFANLGIEYTMADKEAESVPFISIKDASFLKRTWKFDIDVGCMLAPLDHDSIEKMLMVWNASKSITKEAQGIAVISTAIREYFFYGKTEFEDKSILLKKVVNDLNWDLWVEESTFPSYNELVSAFVNNSRRCKSYSEYFV